MDRLRVVLLDACAVLVAVAKVVLGICVVLLGGEAVEVDRLRGVLVDACAAVVAVAKVALGICMVLLGGEAVEVDRLREVLLDACAVLVADGKEELGVCMVLLGGEAVEVDGACRVLANTSPKVKILSKCELGVAKFHSASLHDPEALASRLSLCSAFGFNTCSCGADPVFSGFLVRAIEQGRVQRHHLCHEPFDAEHCAGVDPCFMVQERGHRVLEVVGNAAGTALWRHRSLYLLQPAIPTLLPHCVSFSLHLLCLRGSLRCLLCACVRYAGTWRWLWCLPA